MWYGHSLTRNWSKSTISHTKKGESQQSNNIVQPLDFLWPHKSILLQKVLTPCVQITFWTLSTISYQCALVEYDAFTPSWFVNQDRAVQTCQEPAGTHRAFRSLFELFQQFFMNVHWLNVMLSHLRGSSTTNSHPLERYFPLFNQLRREHEKCTHAILFVCTYVH